MPRRKLRRNSFAKLGCPRLEDRLTPTGNLHISSIYLVEAGDVPGPAPVIGQMVYVHANWTTTGLANGEMYYVRFSVDGVAQDRGPYLSQTGTNVAISDYVGGWYAAPGSHTVQVILDPTGVISESNEFDNSLSMNYSPVTATDLPSKFIRPIYGTLNQSWAIGNYADVDPRVGSRADYRGGTYQYDGHDAIDAGPTDFAKMDAGIPIYAAADGTVENDLLYDVYDRSTKVAVPPDPPVNGNHVWINHGNQWETLYYHLAANSITVKPGDHVKQGQVIGLMGSSGNTSAAHLHFTPFYRRCQVEMGYDPVTYETNPMPYAGDVAPFLFETGVTNYNVSPDMGEHPAPLTTFHAPLFGTADDVVAWFWAYNLNPSAPITLKWYWPDNTLYTTTNYSPPQSFPGAHWWSFHLSPVDWETMNGTWHVAFELGGVEKFRDAFTVTSGVGSQGVSAIKVTQGGVITLNHRTTPYDFGYSQANNPSPITFNILNHGGANLTLSNLVLPPGFSLVGALPTNIAPGSSANLTLQLDANVYEGDKFGAVRVDTNDPLNGTFTFNVAGTAQGSVNSFDPVLTFPPQALAYGYRQQPSLLAPLATVTGNLSNYAGGNLRVEMASGGGGSDQLAIRNTFLGSIHVSGSTVSYNGTPIGTFTGGAGTTPLIISLNSNNTLVATQALLRDITYENTSLFPITSRRYVRFTLTDANANVSNLAIAYITPSGVNRPPFADAGGVYYHVEGYSLMLDAMATTDIENDPLTYSWDINGDGIFGDATGVSPTLTAAQLDTLGLNDGPQTITNVRVQVSDGVNVVNSPSTTLSEFDVAPIAVFTANKTSVPVGGDSTVSFSLMFEPSQADLNAGLHFAYDLNNDGTFDLGNGTYAGSINSSLVAMPGSVYFNTPGPHTVKGRIIDKDNYFTDYSTVITAVLPPRVQSVAINNGAAQRSRVTTLAMTFDSHVTFSTIPEGAFQLTRQSDGLHPLATAIVDDTGATTVVTLSFVGSTAVDFGSLADGRYTLTIDASKISTVGGQLDGDGNATGGDNYVLASAASPDPPTNIFRFFGDANGDGAVAANDFVLFRQAFNGANDIFDFDGDGSVSASDFVQFRQRFNASI
jgi:murein DD-endopeptidase MepM/ murein hydrolase activator NlpD